MIGIGCAAIVRTRGVHVGDAGFQRQDFANEVENLIWEQQPTDAQINRAATRAGIRGVTRGDDTQDHLFNVVTAAFRREVLRDRFLGKIVEIFPDLREPLEEKKRTYIGSEDSTQPEDLPGVSPGRAGALSSAEDILGRISAVGELRSKYREVLLADAQLVPLPMTDLRSDLLAALSQIGGSRDSLINSQSHLSGEMRRLLSMLARIEDGIESCLDAMIYYSQVNDSIENTRRTTLAVGITEADRATAELVRLRELNYCREEFRHRLTRLSEDCGRANAEFP
jgi:hypothetical protein